MSSGLLVVCEALKCLEGVRVLDRALVQVLKTQYVFVFVLYQLINNYYKYVNTYIHPYAYV